MMKARLPLALPFALLAVYAGCSSSSSSTTVEHSSSSGSVTSSSSKTTTSSSKSSSSGSNSTSNSESSSVSASSASSASFTPPAVPTGATTVQTFNKGPYLPTIIGLTTDNYLIFYDNTGGISASDDSGHVTQIAAASEAGTNNTPFALTTTITGNIVVFSPAGEYTTKSVSGNTEFASGTLAIWSHTQTNGEVVKVAENSIGLLAIASDSSYIVYVDGLNSAGTIGNIGIATGAGTGAVDVLTDVQVSEDPGSCFPLAAVDHGYVITSACPVVDGSGAKPTITSFSSTTNPIWGSVTLATGAAPNTLTDLGTITQFDFANDSAGVNVLTLGGANGTTLTSQGITSPTGTALTTSPVGIPTNGEEYFYLSPTSSYALFLTSAGALLKSTYATPTSAPTTSTLAAGPIYGVAGVSPDGNWDVDYTSGISASTGAATSLALRSLSTGTATTLVSNANVSTFGQANLFTTDSQYVVYTSDLTTISVGGESATVGSLVTQSVASGSTPNTIAAASQLVWDATVVTGDTILYNQNYAANLAAASDPNLPGQADYYVVSASGAGAPGTLVVKGADAPDYFYVTSDHTKVFVSFSQVGSPTDGGFGLWPTDGIYVITLPAAPN